MCPIAILIPATDYAALLVIIYQTDFCWDNGKIYWPAVHGTIAKAEYYSQKPLYFPRALRLKENKKG